MEKLIIEIPDKSDAKFIAEVIIRLGYKFESLNDKLKRFIKNSPKNVPLTDNDILNEISIVRKGKGIK